MWLILLSPHRVRQRFYRCRPSGLAEQTGQRQTAVETIPEKRFHRTV